MKKICLFVLSSVLLTVQVVAQDETEEEKRSFKENLFTGGSISLAFYNNTFLIGGTPVFGYSITNWADLGILVNYNYTSYRDYNFIFDNKLRQTVFGGGGFVRLFPLRFIFVQGQAEHNWLRQKEIAPGGTTTQQVRFEATSYLVGGGYTTGREGRGGGPFYYLSILFDVSGNRNSPYTDGYGRAIPVIRGGVQVPLFQGSRSER